MRGNVGYGGSLSHEGVPPQAPPEEGMCLAGYVFSIDC